MVFRGGRIWRLTGIARHVAGQRNRDESPSRARWVRSRGQKPREDRKHMAIDMQAVRVSGGEDFAALLDESLGKDRHFAGSVVRGRVVKIGDGFAFVDVGLKSEGRVELKDFSSSGEKSKVSVGDEIDLFVERYEDKDGTVVLSRDKARREEAWVALEAASTNAAHVTGQIIGRVKGGYTVELGGAQAFLPNSQVDIRPMRDAQALMGTPQQFSIIKMDRARGNIVVSRRAVLEEARVGQRGELIKSLKEGVIFDGIVKNLTDYGAFVDLGGLDGLLHVTDIAWRRVNHPSELLQVGQQVRVQVIRFNAETQRISLGMKQLQADPWDGVAAKYPMGAKFTGRVTNVADYGAFVELQPGIEGLVHVTEMSWSSKAPIHPGKIVSTSQEVDVVVLEVDSAKLRISLGMKQASQNPWEAFLDRHPVGSVVEGEVRSITEFGVFFSGGEDLAGMIHSSALSWEKTPDQALALVSRGDILKAKVLDVDVEQSRISLGVKQIAGDPAAESLTKYRKGEVVTCTVSKIEVNGIEVVVDDHLTGFIRRAELGRDRSDQRPERFSVGERVDARVTAVDRSARRLALSIRGREIDEDKQAVEQYGTSDSGASLGDLLSAAIRRRNQGEG